MTGLSIDGVVTSGIAVDDTFKMLSVVALLTIVEFPTEEVVGVVTAEVKFTCGVVDEEGSIAVVLDVVVVVTIVVDDGNDDKEMVIGLVVDIVVVVVVVAALVVVAGVVELVDTAGFVVDACVDVETVVGATLGNKTHPSGVVSGCHS